MSTTLKILVALLIFVVAVAGFGLVYMYTGSYNIAATDEHTGLTRWVLNTTQERSIRAHAEDVVATLPADSAALLRGYEAFTDMCVVCHGAPGQDRGWMGQGLNPTPPDLSRAAEEFTADEVVWILRNGIKMAGMPALAPTHSDEEILELAAFVERLPDMSEDEYRTWSAQAEAPSSGEASEGDGHAHTH